MEIAARGACESRPGPKRHVVPVAVLGLADRARRQCRSFAHVRLRSVACGASVAERPTKLSGDLERTSICCGLGGRSAADPAAATRRHFTCSVSVGPYRPLTARFGSLAGPLRPLCPPWAPTRACHCPPQECRCRPRASVRPADASRRRAMRFGNASTEVGRLMTSPHAGPCRFRFHPPLPPYSEAMTRTSRVGVTGSVPTPCDNPRGREAIASARTGEYPGGSRAPRRAKRPEVPPA